MAKKSQIAKSKKKPEIKKSSRKRRIGVVVNAKSDKTVSVLVERPKKHARYQKFYKARKHFLAHDGENKYKVGDKVAIEECRPLSKRKCWKVVEEL